MPKVTIIIPLYNAEDTIEDCVNAILAQEYSDFELLLCNDGSKDKSGDICEDLAKNDPRIRVFHLIHEGVSSARNCGLNHAVGDYIAFADSDDKPEAGWLSSLINHRKFDGLSVCGYLVEDTEGNFLYSTANTSEGDSIVEITSEQFIEDIFSNRLMYQGYIWNKLFSRKLIEQNLPLRYNEKISYNEDRLFLFWYLLRCRRVSYSGKPQYVYTKKEDSEQYNPKQATELHAFYIMCRVLEQNSMQQALFNAEKDFFRASAMLYAKAIESDSLDAYWIGKYVVKLSNYIGEFDNYPENIKNIMRKSLICAKEGAHRK